MFAREIEAPSYTWMIDQDDLILAVNENWVEFARCYHPRGGQLADVVGTSIWDYISGRKTRLAYHRLIEKTRRTGEPQVALFRCDCPDYRRWMLLNFHGNSQGGVRFESNIGREDRRPRVRLLETTVPRDGDREVKQCSWCYHVEGPDGDWVEVEDAMRALDIDPASHRMPRLSYAICPFCADRLENLTI